MNDKQEMTEASKNTDNLTTLRREQRMPGLGIDF